MITMEQVMSNIALARSRSQLNPAQVDPRITRLVARLEMALQVRRERRMLAGLGDGMLKDLGLTRADVHSETGRAFWDIPSGRR